MSIDRTPIVTFTHYTNYIHTYMETEFGLYAPYDRYEYEIPVLPDEVFTVKESLEEQRFDPSRITPVQEFFKDEFQSAHQRKLSESVRVSRGSISSAPGGSNNNNNNLLTTSKPRTSFFADKLLVQSSTPMASSPRDTSVPPLSKANSVNALTYSPKISPLPPSEDMHSRTPSLGGIKFPQPPPRSNRKSAPPKSLKDLSAFKKNTPQTNGKDITHHENDTHENVESDDMNDDNDKSEWEENNDETAHAADVDYDTPKAKDSSIGAIDKPRVPKKDTREVVEHVRKQTFEKRKFRQVPKPPQT
ncbi:hypothetical protein RFI_19749 [Reticulomyxa filosa]|uniref:Uncharacterized protein n=1 Tax=Reticulomyxa filosa TaxID=46433 RepID=X6MUQ8_RETFI|nr:hypothetical protein RFI_19749 [Reticulomyxa filosa]|eukprot:ETO17569.1 hypothetical protein RFI_19749 [Reticulomyxa filosa]